MKLKCDYPGCEKYKDHGLDVKVTTDKAISRLSGQFCREHFLLTHSEYVEFLQAYGYKDLYRQEVLRTAPEDAKNRAPLLLNIGGMGLAGETGEVVDLIKKELFHNKPFDRAKMLKELGDVRWYFELLLIATGTTMDEVERRNIDKLRARFPNGFNPEDAAAKKDEVQP